MRKASLLLVFGLVACNSAQDDMDVMRAAVDDLRLEVNRHAEAARAAPTMQYMREELTRHRYEVMPAMGDMDETMSSMRTRCQGLDDLHAMHGELHVEITRHLASMGPMMELPAAQLEVEAYALVMRSTMNDMDDSMHGMHCH